MISGWSHHFVSKRNYHFIIPIDKDWNKLIDVGVLDMQTHLLHGLIHCNGFGHLLCINGIEGGSSLVYGREVMDLWDRICTSLHSREISLVDTSKKRQMDLRLLYGVAYGHTWFGRWDYKFCSGSFGVTKDLYDKALEIVSSLKLDTLIRDRHHSCIKKIISQYRDSSDTELVTIRQLFRFMLSLKYRIPQKKISIDLNLKPKEKSEKCRKFSNLAANLDSRWHVSRLENVANVVVNALKERKARPVKGNSGMSRKEVRESARLHIGDTGLIDYVLKSMNNVIVGEYIVRRAVNASTGILEYSLTEFDQYEESSDQFDSETSESDGYKHVAYLYQRVLMDSVSKIVKGAVRTILDSKNFTKEWPFKDAADEYLRFISRMVPLVGTQLRKSSVGELVVVPLHATVLDLKIEIEKAMRDTYCIMENLEVREIVELEGVDEDDVIFGTIESGSEIMVRGYGVELLMASDLNYDGGEDNWIVNCQCGARDDDGERMVACDLCEVWQHTLCSGIDDDEAVASLFICYRCAQKCTKKVARMGVKDWMMLPVVTETQVGLLY
ncbi:PHD finger protein male meiocyte death 1 [Tanacetum coccineum]